MNSSILLQKLIDIERSIGVETDSTVRHKVLDAEDCLLRMQGELLGQLRTSEAIHAQQRFSLLHAFSLQRNL